MSFLKRCVQDAGFPYLIILLLLMALPFAFIGFATDTVIFGILGLITFLIGHHGHGWFRKTIMSLLAIITVLMVMVWGILGNSAMAIYGHAKINTANIGDALLYRLITAGIMPSLYPEHAGKIPYLTPLDEFYHRMQRLTVGGSAITATYSADARSLTLTAVQMRAEHCPHIIRSLIGPESLAINKINNLPTSFKAYGHETFDELSHLAVNGQTFPVDGDNGEILAADLRPLCDAHPDNEFSIAQIEFTRRDDGGPNYMTRQIQEREAEIKIRETIDRYIAETVERSGSPPPQEQIDNLEQRLIAEEAERLRLEELRNQSRRGETLMDRLNLPEDDQ